MTKDLRVAKKWCLYIIECKDGKLYTGVTGNLEKRIEQHKRSRGCRFTKFRVPIDIKYNEFFHSKKDALGREIEIKGWRKSKKIALFR